MAQRKVWLLGFEHVDICLYSRLITLLLIGLASYAIGKHADIIPAFFIDGLCMLKLLALLQDGRFHSGEVLGAALGISRSAVWKRLQELELVTGLVVQRVRGRGYRLADPLALLECERLVDNPGRWQPWLFESLDSTNAEAFRRLEAGARPPFFVVAEQQTAGRGRRGRQWVSPFGENLYYSLLLRVEGGGAQLEGLSLVVGLAVRAALLELGVVGVGLKWPNDLLVSGRKIAGILLEMSGDPADVCHVVVGIGVNVNMLRADGVGQPWTSMRNELGRRQVDRNVLINSLNAHLFRYTARHLLEGFSALRSEWESAHHWQGRDVSLISGDRVVDGRVLGVDSRGALRLLVDGVERQYSGGELSLRLRDDS